MIKQSGKALAVAVALSFALASNVAYAEPPHRHFGGGGGGGGFHGGGGGGGFHGGGGHRGGGGWHNGGGGAAVGLGIGALMLGGAIAAGAAEQRRCRRPVYDDWGNVVGYRRVWCD